MPFLFDSIDWQNYPLVSNGTFTLTTTGTSFDLDSLFKQHDKVPVVKRIIFHNPATIVFWEDGTKTIVKCMKDEPYSEYYGFVCALAKKIYGSNAKITKLIKQFSEEKKENA